MVVVLADAGYAQKRKFAWICLHEGLLLHDSRHGNSGRQLDAWHQDGLALYSAGQRDREFPSLPGLSGERVDQANGRRLEVVVGVVETHPGDEWWRA